MVTDGWQEGSNTAQRGANGRDGLQARAVRVHGRSRPKPLAPHGPEDDPVLPSEYRHYRGKISLDIHKVPAAEFAHASQEQSTMVAVSPNEARPFPRSAQVPKIDNAK